MRRQKRTTGIIAILNTMAFNVHFQLFVRQVSLKSPVCLFVGWNFRLVTPFFGLRFSEFETHSFDDCNGLIKTK